MFDVAMKMEEKNVNAVTQRANRFVRRENRTGIPTQLKERMEQSTGLSLDDVRVHYNSVLPARLDALAYTKGNQVEIGPGQERHLPHELGHVVQQKLGVVRANARHSSGEALNTDPGLERQADEIGAGKRFAIVQRLRSNVVQRCGDGDNPPEGAPAAAQNRVRRVDNSLYRKMCKAEYDDTIRTRQLQGQIAGTDNTKWLSQSYEKVHNFKNRIVPNGTVEYITEFQMTNDYMNHLEETAIPQEGSTGKPNAKYHYEGLDRNGQYRNYGITAAELGQFNSNISGIITKWQGDRQ